MRRKTHRPLSRAEFDRRFPDEAACAEHLAALRWPGDTSFDALLGRLGTLPHRCHRDFVPQAAATA